MQKEKKEEKEKEKEKEREYDYIINRLLQKDCIWNYKALSLNDTLPLDIVDRLSDKDWDWSIISMHKDLTWEFITKHNIKDWQWVFLSSHHHITMDIIFQNEHLPWDWNELCFNPNLTWEAVSHRLFRPWNWYTLSLVLPITLDIVLRFSTCLWNIKNLLENNHFMADILEKYDKRVHTLENYLAWSRFEKMVDARTLWRAMSDKPCLKMDYVHTHPELPWDYYRMSYNPNVTWLWIQQSDHEWDFYALSYHSNISSFFPERINNPFFQNNWWSISRDPSTNWEMIRDHVLEELCWTSLSYNSNITLDIVRQNIHLPWDYNALSENSSVTINDILAPENSIFNTRWNWLRISRNKNITLEIVQKYPELPWNYKGLSFNKNIATLSNLPYMDTNMPWDWSGIAMTLHFKISGADKKEMLKTEMRNNLFNKKIFNVQLMGSTSHNLKQKILEDYRYYEDM